MEVVLCDNRECRRQLNKENRNTLILNRHGNKVQIDLCDDCSKDLFNNVESLIQKMDINEKKVTTNKVTNKTSKRKDVDKIVEEYGVEKLIEQYQVDRLPMSTIAKQMGLSPSSLSKYMDKHNIGKNSNSENIKITDIDAQRYDKNVVRLLQLKETTIDNIPESCRNCAYKNKTNNTCWYTMVTNKQAKRTENSCEHYVDIRKVNND